MLKDLFYSHDIKELGRYNQFKVNVETKIYVAKRNTKGDRIGAGNQLNH